MASKVIDTIFEHLGNMGDDLLRGFSREDVWVEQDFQEAIGIFAILEILATFCHDFAEEKKKISKSFVDESDVPRLREEARALSIVMAENYNRWAKIYNTKINAFAEKNGGVPEDLDYEITLYEFDEAESDESDEPIPWPKANNK